MVLIVFAVSMFISATLLFLVEPMLAKMALPMLGGTPAVWNTCLVFFQAVLLAGYLYAHAATRWLGRRTQIAVHIGLALTFLAVLPLRLPAGWEPPARSNPSCRRGCAICRPNLSSQQGKFLAPLTSRRGTGPIWNGCGAKRRRCEQRLRSAPRRRSNWPPPVRGIDPEASPWAKSSGCATRAMPARPRPPQQYKP